MVIDSNMKKIVVNIFFLLASMMLTITGCSESDLLHPAGKDDGSAPGQVTNVRVRNWSGAATISYDLPKDSDLSYVKATFIGTNGAEREMRASSYVDSLVLEGFGDTKEYTIEIRSYDKFENASAPVSVKINPLDPPVNLVFKSLSWDVDFGGFVVNFDNVTKSKVGIYVTRRDSVSKEQEYYDAYFTESSGGHFSVRGLPDEENEFGLYVMDHWGNSSEIKTFTVTPWREDFLDKSKFEWINPVRVPGDLKSSDWHRNPQSLWNGIIDNWDYGHTIWPLEFPHRFTFDLGVTAKMSRVKTWQRTGDDVRWQHGAWRLFKVYGCTELPSGNSAADPFEGWTLIGDFVSVKPSGLPIGQVSDEDIQLLNEGEEFSFDRDAPSVRYLRFEINGVHSAMKLSCMSEISLWGEIEK
jgi:hypothetical protein